MKLTLIIWNILLTIGLGILFFKGMGGNQVLSGGNHTASDSINTSRIAYVNVDSLEDSYELFSMKKKELELKQNQAEAIFNKKMSDFQTAYAAAQETAAKMTPAQLESTQRELQQKQMELQQLQERLQNDFQKQLEDFNKLLKDSLDSYLKDYNADKHFSYILSMTDAGAILYAEPHSDITDEVVKGMNERLKKE